jgi:hypothetical protein
MLTEIPLGSEIDTCRVPHAGRQIMSRDRDVGAAVAGVCWCLAIPIVPALYRVSYRGRLAGCTC